MVQSSDCRLLTVDCRLDKTKYNEISHYQAIKVKIPIK